MSGENKQRIKEYLPKKLLWSKKNQHKKWKIYYQNLLW